jgi:hypothetical protein
VSQDELAIANSRPGRVGARAGGYGSRLNLPTKLGRRWHAGHIWKVFDGGGVGRRASHGTGALVVGCVRALGNAAEIQLRGAADPS